MAQHFLLSAASRTLSLRKIYKAGEVAAYETFCEMRWPETNGEAVCPKCGHDETYNITTRRKFKCKACAHQFSVTSGTIFASRKMDFVDLLAAICIIVNASKGISMVAIWIASTKRRSFWPTSCVRLWRLRFTLAKFLTATLRLTALTLVATSVLRTGSQTALIVARKKTRTASVVLWLPCVSVKAARYLSSLWAKVKALHWQSKTYLAQPPCQPMRLHIGTRCTMAG